MRPIILTPAEGLLVNMLARLYWLTTQAPGVARYASDVRFFVDAEKLVHSDPAKIAELESMALDYDEEER